MATATNITSITVTVAYTAVQLSYTTAIIP